MAARAVAAIQWTGFHSVRASCPCVASFSASYRLSFDRHLQWSCVRLNDNEVTQESVKGIKVSKGTAGRFGSKVPATRSTLPFEEFIENRKKLKLRSRIAGVPFGLLGLTASSMASAYTFPNMFDTPPEEIQPIL